MLEEKNKKRLKYNKIMQLQTLHFIFLFSVVFILLTCSIKVFLCCFYTPEDNWELIPYSISCFMIRNTESEIDNSKLKCE